MVSSSIQIGMYDRGRRVAPPEVSRIPRASKKELKHDARKSGEMMLAYSATGSSRIFTPSQREIDRARAVARNEKVRRWTTGLLTGRGP